MENQIATNQAVEKTAGKPKRAWWQRALAMVCVIALLISTFSFLTQVKISPEDGIGADVLAENNPYVDASATERLSYAAVSYLMLGEGFQRSYQQASYYIGRGNYAKALTYLENCISQCRDNTDKSILDDLWLKYGCVQAVLGNYEAALEGFNNLSDGSSYAAEREIVSAQIALEKGQMDKAYTHLGAYLELNPNDNSVYGLFADCCYYSGDPAAAVEWYARAENGGIVLEPSEYMLWCMCLMDLQKPEEALKKAVTALDKGYADTSLCYSQCAICYYMLGQFQETLEFGARALETTSESVDYGMLVFYMGLSTFALEQYEMTMEYLNTAAELGCQEGELWFYRGFSKMLLEDPAGAVEDFTRSMDAEALYDNSCLYRGICGLQMGSVESAVADLKVAAQAEDQAIADAARELLVQLELGESEPAQDVK